MMEYSDAKLLSEGDKVLFDNPQDDIPLKYEDYVGDELKVIELILKGERHYRVKCLASDGEELTLMPVEIEETGSYQTQKRKLEL